MEKTKAKLSHHFIATMTMVSCIIVTLFVSFVVIIEDQIEVLSLHHWLDAEANRYFTHISADQSYTPNPNEFDYYTSDKPMPAWLSNYNSPGFYEHELGPEDRHFLVRKIDDSEHFFYLVFRKNADDFLDGYESKLFKFTITLAVVFLLLMVLFSIYLVRLITLPFDQLHRKIEYISPNSSDFTRDAQYQEFAVIENALYESKKRMEHFFQREQEFSRFAAHEIRTPLMVLKGSSELLNQIEFEQPIIKKAISRITTASDDIGLLINTFLLLGKENIDSHFYKEVNLHDIINQCISEATTLFKHRQLKVSTELEQVRYVNAPPEFINVLVSNLIKNSFTYAREHSDENTENTDISLVLTQQFLSITNGYDTEEIKSGYGYGLVIVKRICQRLNWQFTVEKNNDKFTIVIGFSEE